jgi:glycopeptide antibiotics resistance protein
MAQVWQSWGAVIVASVLGLPIALLVAEAMARRRAVPRRYAYAEVFVVAGTLPWLWMVLTPRPGAGAVEAVPLRGLVHVLSAGPTSAVVQIGGNLLVFAAFGFCAPIRWRIGLPAVLGLAAAGAVTIELLQYALALGRVSSVDDVGLNAAGAGLAALLSRRWWRPR